MSIKRIATEASLYITGIVLSCGVSQLYGLIKGGLDLKKYCTLRSKIHQWKSVEALCLSKNYEKLKASKAFKVLSAEAQGAPEEILYQRILAKARDRLFDINERLKIRKTSLQKDFVSLIPVVGALFAWRIGAGKSGKELSMRPFFEHAFAHASNSWKGFTQKLFYPKSRSHEDIGDKNHVKIPVDVRGGELDAIFYPGFCAAATDPVVVIFHGNGCTCEDMEHTGRWYSWQGYNVLMPTMGGYPGSPGVSTSEATSYQDVEAIKKYIESRGIKEAGYHGVSIGGTLAMQAAAGKSEAKVKTLFAVADKTLNHAFGVVENVVNPLMEDIRKHGSTLANVVKFAIPYIAKGVARMTFPERKVRLSNTLVIETDGLDNLRKAKLLRAKKIPLLAIKSSLDSLMGLNLRDGRYHDNFADHLIRGRYGDELGKEHLIEIAGKHGANFRSSEEAQKRLREFILAAK